MKIVFFPVGCCPFHGKSLNQRPLGGTETSIILLSEALERMGHEVIVLTPLKEFPSSNPVYINRHQADKIDDIDALIVCRGWQGTLGSKAKKTFFWTGDSYDNPHTNGIGDQRFIEKVDGLFAVSDWHAKTLCHVSGFPLEKTHVLRNGVDLSNYYGNEVKIRKRLIYSSTPYRGLCYLPEIFTRIKALHPEAELHIFSSFALYREKWPSENLSEGTYDKVFKKLATLQDCYVHGNVLQKQLAREFMKSALLAYPSNYEETGCITALEAQAGGCAIVTSDLAALKEAVGESGILIKEKPGSPEYINKFVESCDRLLSDDRLFQQFSQKGLEQSKEFDWSKRAEGLIKYFKDKHEIA